MRRAWLPLLAMSAGLAGCSISVSGAIPGTHGHAAVYHIATSPIAVHALSNATGPIPGLRYAAVAAAPAPAVIDLPTLYRTVLRVPSLVSELDRDLFLCTCVIALIGSLNAVLLMRLPAAVSATLRDSVVRRVGASVDGMLEGAKLELLAAATNATTSALPGQPEAERTCACACGSAISVRSRSGLCRSCAQVVRLTRRRFGQASPKLALASISAEPGDTWEHPTTAIVARSRIGECRQYYAVEFGASSEQQEIFIELIADRLAEPAMRSVYSS
jgi:hypothetical protein